MSARTAGRKRHGTPFYTLVWANEPQNGLELHQTTTTATKSLSDSFWEHSSPVFGTGLFSEELDSCSLKKETVG